MVGRRQQASDGGAADPLHDVDYIWENRRSYACFGWHRPMVTPRWSDRHGNEVPKSEGRPSTRAYREVLNAKELPEHVDQSVQDWTIWIDDKTDEAGWQYGGVRFWELIDLRLAMRSTPRRLDFIKRRR
mmetsp:Transcript_21361/g.64043  ORF Transcript_21361/g.64043 Transcript_21361/m.64043 type:complete len:129 (+) Transcript_21361:121-507(+)